MAYDDELVERVRAVMAHEAGLTERQMFGGHGFMVDGNLAVSASSRGGLMVRVDAAETGALTEEPGVEPFEMRGRPMTGWLHVDTGSLDDDETLRRWVGRGVAYARSLPAK